MCYNNDKKFYGTLGGVIMKGIIEILMDEHKEILKFVESLHKKCLIFMEEDKISIQEFRDGIQFIREFADKAHHQKEEKVLFRAMMEHLGPTAEKLVKGGMLVEHDLARLHVSELEKAIQAYEENPNAKNKLDILANAMGYCYLLKRHAMKEDEVVYPFAQRALSSEVMEQLDREAAEYMKELEQ